MTQVTTIIGVLLAGGQSARMGGGDKCLRLLGGQSLLDRAIARARPQVDELLLNTNGDVTRFSGIDLPIIPDSIEGYAGPLAGILSVLEWARAERPHCTHVVSFASDTPFFPMDLVARLIRAAQEKQLPLACAASGGRAHPVFGLWPVALADDLRHAMTRENMRKVDVWTARHGVALAEYQVLPFDPFFNINQQEDLALAAQLASIPDKEFEA
ncbi:MAG: molybdenum cofactor guanylyltransferase MobA [Pseudomonadota bacterium]